MMKIFNLHITTEEEMKKIICKAWDEGEDFNKRLTRMSISPIIGSLIKLRENTWDVKRVDCMIDWLNNMIKDDESDNE